jgi:hypothetical protein
MKGSTIQLLLLSLAGNVFSRKSGFVLGVGNMNIAILYVWAMTMAVIVFTIDALTGGLLL